VGGRRQKGGRAGSAQDASVGHALLERQVHLGAVGNHFLDEVQAGELTRADRRRVPFFIVAAARLADPGDHVQRSEARALVIRVGAGFQENDRQFKMAVLDRQGQRTVSGLGAARGRLLGLQGFVDIGPLP